MTLSPWTHAIIDSLRSGMCPACRAAKHFRQSFCRACYRRLDRDTKQRLYDLVGNGYEEAMQDACAQLGCKLATVSSDGIVTEHEPIQP